MSSDASADQPNPVADDSSEALPLEDVHDDLEAASAGMETIETEEIVDEEFDENDFDEDFDDDFEEEIQGEYDLEDDQYGDDFNTEFGHLTPPTDDDNK